jgi:hypothetical protein
MATKPIDRLMFAQGGDCFFCRKPLPRADASVEHLVAVSNGGGDYDENCVACCKSLNRLFGHMSLKEKLTIILNQRGDFRCPAAPVEPAQTSRLIETNRLDTAPQTNEERVAMVLADLHKRGNAKPASLEKWLNTIRSKLAQAGDAGDHAETILGELSAREIITVAEKRVTYSLPARTV